jgi:type IV secretory pathway VirB10-like protein
MPCAHPHVTSPATGPVAGPANLLRAGLVVPMLATLLLTALPAQAQWKWRDASGQITASDLPPPRSVPDKDVLQRPDPNARRAPAVPTAAASAPAVAAPGKPPVDKDLEARRRAGDAEAQSKAKADEEKLAQQRAENCRRAKGHLAALDSGQRMSRTNDKGEREILDDKGRAEERRRASEVVASDCR